MKYDITIDNKKYIVEVDTSNVNILEKSELQTSVSGADEFDDIPDFDFSDETADENTVLKSPVFGTVIGVKVKSGDSVKKGDTLVVIESMKMENEIPAAEDCVIDTVLVKPGDVIKKDQGLMSVKTSM